MKFGYRAAHTLKDPIPIGVYTYLVSV